MTVFFPSINRVVPKLTNTQMKPLSNQSILWMPFEWEHCLAAHIDREAFNNEHFDYYNLKTWPTGYCRQIYICVDLITVAWVMLFVLLNELPTFLMAKITRLLVKIVILHRNINMAWMENRTIFLKLLSCLVNIGVFCWKTIRTTCRVIIQF